MKLDTLIADSGHVVSGSSNADITGICYDSRRVENGNIFFAMARDAEQNQNNIDEALSRGARAVVVRRWSGASRPAAILIESERPRRLMGLAAARFYNRPSRGLDLIG